MFAFPNIEQLSSADPADCPKGTVDIWSYRYAADLQAGRLARAESVLSADERLQHARFRFVRDRDLYLATRVLLRFILSRYAEVTPADWQFTRTVHGKPSVAGPAIGTSLRFNLSNVHGIVVCAVTRSAASLGIDVEPIVPRADALDIAHAHFAAIEVADLLSQSTDQRDERFTAYWTLKESFVKALGGGLTIPLSGFAFHLNGSDIGLIVSSEFSLEPARWQFALLAAPGHHLVALSAETAGAPLDLRAGDFDLT